MSATPHIFTLTGNLLAERTLTFDSWAPGRTQRAAAESFQVGGKGINVSKMLTRLGAANTALCFAGGSAGDECFDWLHNSGRHFYRFATTPPTRTGTVVRAPGQPETTFLGVDAQPDARAILACADFLDAQPAHQVLAVCGSLPGWSSSDYQPLRAALGRWAARGVLVVDTYGAPLKWFVTHPAALIKINADEFKGLTGAATPDLVPAIAGTALIRRWIVSDGPRQIWLRDENGATAILTPPAVREVSPTGSGDVLLACILHAWINRGMSTTEAVQFALPYAAANAAHPGVAEFPEPPASASGNFTK